MLNLKYILHLGLWDCWVYTTLWLDVSNISQFTVLSFCPMITYWAMVRCSVSIKLHQYINGKHCEWYLAIFCLQTCLGLWVVSLLVRRPTHFPFFFYFWHFKCFLFEILKRKKQKKLPMWSNVQFKNGLLAFNKYKKKKLVSSWDESEGISASRGSEFMWSPWGSWQSVCAFVCFVEVRNTEAWKTVPGSHNVTFGVLSHLMGDVIRRRKLSHPRCRDCSWLI
jgi:hypothetical protein